MKKEIFNLAKQCLPHSTILIIGMLLVACSPQINNEQGEVVAITTGVSDTTVPTVPTGSDLTLSPSNLTVTILGSAAFTASGGTAPYIFELVAGVGTLDADGAYLAGSAPGVAVIRVTDATGNSALSSALVYAPVALSPASTTVVVNSTVNFIASQGVPPHTFSISSGSGTIGASTGVFTAPAVSGSSVVVVTDSLGETDSASVTVNSALAISPATFELAVNNSAVFSALGGVPPYTFTVPGVNKGTVGATSGIYTAPALAGAASVVLTDSLGNSAISTITIRAALSLSPANPVTVVSNTIPFTASGGVSPYTYSIGFGGGSVNASSGIYTAPVAAGSAVVVATDSLGNTTNTSVTINPPVSVTPSAVALGAGGVSTFSGSGGIPPYVFSVVGTGAINPSTGEYTAPGSLGTDTVRVTDSLGNTADASVAVSSALSISPATITVAVNNEITFSGSGGIAPYTYSISSGGGSIIAASGQFTAPSVAGTATVRVTDAALDTSMATITVNPALVITPSTLTLSVNKSATLSASGGVGTYTYSIESGGGTVNASTGDFTAGASSGTTVVAVTDSRGNVSRSTITIRPALSVVPATKYVVINTTSVIEPSGGVPPFTFAITAGPGAINAATGAFTAGALTAQTTTIEVTDALSDSIFATVISVKPVQIAASRIAACARMDNGTVQCWGGNDSGQLGNGTLRDSSFPVSVQGLTNVVSISGSKGGSSFCALISDGTIQCWGDNNAGQIGIGTSNGAQSLPAFVSGITTATAVSIGTSFACALLSDTTVKCWGSNGYGQFGNGSTTSSPIPVAAGGGISGVTSLSAGSLQTCVALNDGTARCWGSNTLGQLGNGSISAVPVTSPQTVQTLTAVTQVLAGGGFSCALDTGNLYCWGGNSYGQLGVGNFTDSSTPLNTGISGISSIDVGYYTVCAALGTPALKCWGEGATGAIGDGGAVNRNVPTADTGLTTAVSLASNGTYTGASTCALQASGQIQCWGYNSNGQLGNGSSYSVVKPVAATLPMAATALTSGVSHTCALLTDKSVRCWGRNSSGQLGNGTTTDSLVPVAVSGLTDAIGISAGSSHTCAILSDKTLKCWGYNNYGQIGDNTTVQRTVPVAVGGISDVAELHVGYYHTCARITGGTLNCWGANSYGQLGDGSLVERHVPVAVLGLGGAVTSFGIAKGYFSAHTTCAVLDNGTAQCWGSNSFGQLGNGNQTSQSLPADVLNLSGVTQINLSGQATCAALNSGDVSCWGQNSDGQLGNGTTTNTFLANTTVIGLGNPATLTSGGAHACALSSGGQIYCWGLNKRGQIGAGTATGYYAAPFLLQDASSFVNVEAAGDRTCALTNAGEVKCWGMNLYGEAGNGEAGGDTNIPGNVIFR